MSAGFIRIKVGEVLYIKCQASILISEEGFTALTLYFIHSHPRIFLYILLPQAWILEPKFLSSTSPFLQLFPQRQEQIMAQSSIHLEHLITTLPA